MVLLDRVVVKEGGGEALGLSPVPVTDPVEQGVREGDAETLTLGVKLGEVLPLPVALLLFSVGTPLPLPVPLHWGVLETVREVVRLTLEDRVMDREGGREAELLVLPELLLLPVGHTDMLIEVVRDREGVGELEGLTEVVLDRVKVEAEELLGGRVMEEQAVEDGDWLGDLDWELEVVKLKEPLGDPDWDRLEVPLRVPLEHPLPVPPTFVLLRVLVPPTTVPVPNATV